jgi:hypothetical protein
MYLLFQKMSLKLLASILYLSSILLKNTQKKAKKTGPTAEADDPVLILQIDCLRN